MANNEYVNRVDFGDETLIDISDTTAEPEDVIEGQTFYTKSGAPATGTLGDATTTTHGLMSATDKVKLDEMDSKKAPIIINSKSGNPIAIDDGIPGLKIYDMKVSFSPKQEGSGDPSPTNVRPIAGLDGVVIKQEAGNLLPLIDFVRETNGITFTYYPNGDLHVEGTSGSGGAFLNVPTDTYFTIEPGEYTLSGNIAGSKLNMYVVVSSTHGGDIKWNTINSSMPSTRVIDFTDSSTRIQVSVNGNTTVNATIHPRIERGSSATPMTTYPISWQSEDGTVYGGTLDVLTGTLTVTHKHVKVSDFTWTYNTNGVMRMASNTPSDMLKNGLVISDNYKTVPNVGNWSSFQTVDDYSITQYAPSDNLCIVIKDSRYTVPATFVSEQGNVGIVYELAEPYIIQLDPVTISTLIDTNTIWTDADAVEIAYPVDTKKYVDTGASDVKDVQIKGTSILQDGVANIPISGIGRLGVVRTEGLGLSVNQNSGEIMVSKASND